MNVPATGDLNQDDLENMRSEIIDYIDEQLKNFAPPPAPVVKPPSPTKDSSDTDSAYQLAQEFGGGYYCGHKSERAKLRNFRKCKCPSPIINLISRC